MNTDTAPQIDELLAVDEGRITTLIDAGVEITGTVCVTNGRALLVSGTVIGNVRSDGPVIVNRGGVVRGSIAAASLQIAGCVERLTDQDLIDVSGAMVLAATGVVKCDAVSAGVKTAYGAVMHGSFRPRQDQASSDVPEGRTASSTERLSLVSPATVFASSAVASHELDGAGSKQVASAA